MTGGLAAAIAVSDTTWPGGSSAATTSHTPTEGDVEVLMYIMSSGSPFTATTTVSSHGMTWVKGVELVSGNDLLGIWYGYGAGPHTSAGDTITFSRAPTAGRYIVYRLPAAYWNTGGNPVAASAADSGTGTGGSIALTSVSGDAGVRYGFWIHKANEATTPDSTGATWAEDLDTNSATSVAHGMETQRLQGVKDDTHTATWATSSAYAGLCIQLKETVPLKYQALGNTPVKVWNRPVPIDEDADVFAIIG